jgi:hypothetical protein
MPRRRPTGVAHHPTTCRAGPREHRQCREAKSAESTVVRWPAAPFDSNDETTVMASSSRGAYELHNSSLMTALRIEVQGR